MYVFVGLPETAGLPVCVCVCVCGLDEWKGGEEVISSYISRLRILPDALHLSL